MKTAEIFRLWREGQLSGTQIAERLGFPAKAVYREINLAQRRGELQRIGWRKGLPPSMGESLRKQRLEAERVREHGEKRGDRETAGV